MDERQDFRQLIADWVRRARLARDATMNEAAESSGVSHVTWRRIENAQTVKSGSYAAVDRFLKLPLGTTALVAETGELPAADEESIQAAKQAIRDNLRDLERESLRHHTERDDSIREELSRFRTLFTPHHPRYANPSFENTVETIKQLPLPYLYQLRGVLDMVIQVRESSSLEEFERAGDILAEYNARSTRAIAAYEDIVKARRELGEDSAEMADLRVIFNDAERAEREAAARLESAVRNLRPFLKKPGADEEQGG